MMDYMFGDGGAQSRHPIRQPFRDTAAMEGKIGDAGTLHLLILMVELRSNPRPRMGMQAHGISL